MATTWLSPFKVIVPASLAVSVTDPAVLLQVVLTMPPDARVGEAGTALTVTAVPDAEIHELSDVLLTKIVCEPGNSPAKVAEPW